LLVRDNQLHDRLPRKASFDVFGIAGVKKFDGHYTLARIGAPISEAPLHLLYAYFWRGWADLLLRQELFSFAELGPDTVGVSHERHNLHVVSTGFLPISGELGGECGAVKSIESLR
jgi:hypothetical protein